MYLIIALPFLQAFQCKKNELNNPNTPTVKLVASLNNSNEVINLGDTLKFKLVVPDTITTISKLDGSQSKVPVTSLQSCSWVIKFYIIDTINKIGSRIFAPSSLYTIEGPIDSYGGIYTTTSKPYMSNLIIVPKTKGIYYVDFGNQETLLNINNGFSVGLRVNINASNKHWNLLDPTFPNISQSINTSYETQGYGYYCFRVN